MDITQLGITREEILSLAAQRIADEIGDTSGVWERVNQEISQRVSNAIGSNLSAAIDEFLKTELYKLVDKEFTPVDMWGDKTGKPTTIRSILADRAMKFWETPVDDQGRESNYGGRPRHERVYGQIVKEKFDEAIKANAELLISQFKQAIKADAVKLTSEHIDKLIKTK